MRTVMVKAKNQKDFFTKVMLAHIYCNARPNLSFIIQFGSYETRVWNYDKEIKQINICDPEDDEQIFNKLNKDISDSHDLIIRKACIWFNPNQKYIFNEKSFE